MQRFILSALLLFTATQKTTAQNAAAVIRAERNFAAHALEHGAKSAFLTYTDSSAVSMEGGEYGNALAQWRARPDSKVLLQWGPQFAAASTDGSSGFTTGPYYMQIPGTDTLLATGQYTTFWLRNSRGEWKYLIDFGIRFPKQLYASPPAEPITASLIADSQATARGAEDAFLTRYETAGPSAYNSVLDSQCRLNMDRSKPVSGSHAFLRLVTSQPHAPQFVPVGAFLSAGKDLAYVYGDLVYGNDKSHYLRIWGHTPAGWKILVQVMQLPT